MSGTDLAIFLLVVGSRFLVPLLIPRFPLSAIIACLVIDAADQTIFDQFTDLDQTNYQSYDKALDIYYLTIAYLAVLRNWTNGFAAEVARFLWYYRLIGVVLFELFEVRALLFIFPNTFEFYFIAYELVRTGWDPRRLVRSRVLWLAAFIWVVIKLPQEWWIHIAQNDFTDFTKETIFGVEPDASWGSAFSNRPGVTLALLVGAALIAVVAVLVARRLPPRDWSIRFDVDRPVPDTVLDPDRYPDVGNAGPELRWPRLEKVALITLVSIVFAQLLQIGASNLQVLGAAALVVIANAALSDRLAARGVEWRSIGLEFVVLGLLNAALISGFAAVTADGGINRGAAVFFGLLLTLIIVLYDRFRDIRLRDAGVRTVPPNP